MPVPRLSIILAVPGDPSQMDDALASVLQNRPAGCEVLVALDRPYSDPYDLKGEVTFFQASPGDGLVPMVNQAIDRARGDLVHVLTCGLRAVEGWTDGPLACFDDLAVGAVVPLVCDRQGRVLSAGAAYDPRGSVRRLGWSGGRGKAGPRQALVDPDFGAAFYRRTALEQVGRLREGLGDRLAGLDLGLALQAAGYQCLLEPGCRLLAESRPRDAGGAFQRGRAVERLFWRWLPPQRRWSCLLRHAWMLAGDGPRCFYRPRKAMHMAGRLAGMLRPLKGSIPAGEAPCVPTLTGPHFAASRVARQARKGAA